MDFLKNLSLNDDANSTRAPVQTSDPAHEQQGHGHGLLHKLGDALKEEMQPPSSLSTPVPPKEEHLLDKLSNAFGHSTPPPAPAPKHEGLLGKLEEAVGHVTKDNSPPKPQTLEDKINNMLGGGAKGEAKEDGLDKAIDFVQEHVLKEGQQKNESAIEQLKDEQIAHAIRNGFKSVTGKELPSLNLFGQKKDDE
ncbi:hypothetical protein E4T56_gene12860 [Termitomyces sp. T112]|nr:hypothetical protein E4T56_gene12860 [Termitomyces sp. T112]KAH0584664.1 hypothetical protein H2248_010195 [Termitomyces sp. 'cryptogamus']